MSPDFAFTTINGVELLVFQKWWTEGLIHGMTTRPLSFSVADTPRSSLALCAAVGATQLAMLQQCHGKAVIDLRNREEFVRTVQESGGNLCRFRQGDALLAPAVAPEKIALGVLSADCVPVILRAAEGWALVHAGWRGLANGVISESVRALGQPTEAAVFASAGGEAYEVGPEVIAAIGESAVFKASPLKAGAFLLDTAATAVSQLRRISQKIEVASSGICTLSDIRFHSFRRDGDLAGRAVTFVLPANGNH